MVEFELAVACNCAASVLVDLRRFELQVRGTDVEDSERSGLRIGRDLRDQRFAFG
jgi:hypothetical protein